MSHFNTMALAMANIVASKFIMPSQTATTSNGMDIHLPNFFDETVALLISSSALPAFADWQAAHKANKPVIWGNTLADAFVVDNGYPQGTFGLASSQGVNVVRGLIVASGLDAVVRSGKDKWLTAPGHPSCTVLGQHPISREGWLQSGFLNDKIDLPTFTPRPLHHAKSELVIDSNVRADDMLETSFTNVTKGPGSLLNAARVLLGQADAQILHAYPWEIYPVVAMGWQRGLRHYAIYSGERITHYAPHHFADDWRTTEPWLFTHLEHEKFALRSARKLLGLSPV